MADEISTTLKQHFGFEQFRAGQREVIEFLLSGASAAAVFPTGGGKSLCYQLPALMLPGITLVVSPLIALMKDQIDALANRNIAARRLDSTLTAQEYREVMEQVRSGEVRLLYVAPERFNNERFRESINRLPVSLFAVDEAHCISEWGHNFRPDYLKLASFARQCKAERILALTATATPKVLSDICNIFDIAPGKALRTGFYRPNLKLITTPVAETERDQLLIDRLRENPPGPSIVYVTLQRTAESLATRLSNAGFLAKPYHAGMKNELRSQVQEWFMSTENAIVVATIAFGMGIDKSDIRYVYHYNLPKSLENYSQEIGRAGRDGNPALCQMLVCPDDLNVLENFIYGDTASLQAIRGLVASLFSQGVDFDLSLHTLANDHDIRPLVLRTLLTYLELEQYLEGGTPFYSDYRFKPLLSSRDILSRFSGQRHSFLAGLLRQAIKARSWFSIDPASAALNLRCDREKVVRTLDWLGEQQMLEVQAAGVRHRYQRLKAPQTPDLLADELHQRLLKREAAELGRLQQVLELAGLDACRTSALAAHFGEQMQQPCGHCSWCLKENHQILQRNTLSGDPEIWHQARQLAREQKELLTDPRALARFLCGVRSPKLSRTKLTRHKLFGALEQVPFQEVLAEAGTIAE